MLSEHQSNEDLAGEIKNKGDPSGEVRLELLRRNQGFIRSQWRPFSGIISESELWSVAFLAVDRACRIHDSDRGTFLQSLSYSLKSEFVKAVNDESRGVYLPRYLSDEIRVYQRAVEKITLQTGKTPSVIEISAATGFSEEHIQELQQIYTARVPLSFSTPVNQDDENETTLADVVPDTMDLSETVTEKSYRDSLAELFIYILSGLPQEQQTVIRSQYYSGETVKSISCDMGISAAEVRRLSSNAIKTMRMNSRLQHFFAEENVYLRSGLQRFRITSESSTEYSALQLYYQKEGHK